MVNYILYIFLQMHMFHLYKHILGVPFYYLDQIHMWYIKFNCHMFYKGIHKVNRLNFQDKILKQPFHNHMMSNNWILMYRLNMVICIYNMINLQVHDKNLFYKYNLMMLNFCFLHPIHMINNQFYLNIICMGIHKAHRYYQYLYIVLNMYNYNQNMLYIMSKIHNAYKAIDMVYTINLLHKNHLYIGNFYTNLFYMTCMNLYILCNNSTNLHTHQYNKE